MEVGIIVYGDDRIIPHSWARIGVYASEYCNGLQNSVSGYSGVNIVKEKRKLQI